MTRSGADVTLPGRLRRLPEFVGLALLGGLASILLLQWTAPELYSSVHVQGTDDAYITYRYALNLASGEGIVYNPGERVEGYSNLGMVLLSAAVLSAVEAGALYRAITVIDVSACLALVVFVGYVASRVTGSRRWGAAAVASAAVSPFLWHWALSGMEAVLVAALEIAACAAASRVATRGRRAPAVLALAASGLLLLRADGFVFAAGLLAALLLDARSGSFRLHGSLLLPLGVLAALVTWRLAYYGEWLPNTYFAKIEGPAFERLRAGLDHLVGLVLRRGLAVPLLLALAAVASPRRFDTPADRLATYCGFACLWTSAWVVVVGGDHFGVRFLLLAHPAGVLIASALFRRGLLRGGALLALPLAALLSLATAPPRPHSPFRYDGWVELGRYLRSHRPGRLLGIGAAGKVPYFSGLETIDMRGLNDRHIARQPADRFVGMGHNKQDLEYVLSRRPDLIAGFIMPGLDLNLGLDAETLRRTGYELTLMANIGPRSMPRNVVEVCGLDHEERRRLWEVGFRFGVVEPGGCRAGATITADLADRAPREGGPSREGADE